MPDWCKPIILDTDASDAGIGAVLSQVQEDAYASCLLSKAERNYCITRKELLTVVSVIYIRNHAYTCCNT